MLSEVPSTSVIKKKRLSLYFYTNIYVFFIFSSDASSCAVGTCAGGLHCTDYNWTDKLTLAEWGYGNNRRYYDLSVVAGYNIPMQIYPAAASTGCLTKTVYGPNPPVGQAWLPSEGASSPSVANCVPNANFGITFCPS